MATIVTLTSTESGANSLTDINSNFTNLNSDKAETSSLPVKATGAEINTGTNDTKFATPKAIADSNVAFIADIPVKASSSDINTGTDDAKFATALALANQTVLAKSASPTFTGTVTLPKTLLGEASVQLDAALSADGKWCGITETGTAAATLAFGQLCYFVAASSKWDLAKADSSTTSVGKLGICVLAASGDAQPTEVLLYGKVRADAQFPSLTIGAPVYISGATAGAIVTAQPTTTDYVIRNLGFGNTADELFFCPSPDYMTHT